MLPQNSHFLTTLRNHQFRYFTLEILIFLLQKTLSLSILFLKHSHFTTDTKRQILTIASFLCRFPPVSPYIFFPSSSSSCRAMRLASAFPVSESFSFCKKNFFVPLRKISLKVISNIYFCEKLTLCR